MGVYIIISILSSILVRPHLAGEALYTCRIIHAAALVAQVGVFFWGRWTDRFPLFTLFQTMVTAQTVGYFENIDMNNSWWHEWALALVFLRIACAFELVHAWVTKEWWHLYSLLSVMGIGLAMLVFQGRLNFGPPNEVMTAVLLWCNACLIVCLLFGIFLMWMLSEHPSRAARIQTWFFMALMLNQIAGILLWGRLPWEWVMAATYLIAAATYGAWVWAVHRWDLVAVWGDGRIRGVAVSGLVAWISRGYGRIGRVARIWTRV